MIVHIAGPLVDSVQRCAACGEVLSDYRGAMIPDGQPPLFGWSEGAHIQVATGFGATFSSVVAERWNCTDTERVQS